MPAPVIAVYGEPTFDWFFQSGQERARHEGAQVLELPHSDAHPLQGGAFLLSELINKVRNSSFRLAAPKWKVEHEGRFFHHSYATLGKVRTSESKEIWAVQDFLGLKKADFRTEIDDASLKRMRPKEEDAARAQITVLDDEDLGFRDCPALWPSADNEDSWVLLKMGGRVASGNLWQHLYSTLAERLVVVVDIKDLRKMKDIEVSKDLSWERTARDLAGEIIHKPSINALSRCSYVVIHFGAMGALIVKPPVEPHNDQLPTFTLLFDPERTEGHWESLPGKIWGHTSMLTAVIAQEMMQCRGKGKTLRELSIERATRRGLNAMRKLRLIGYGEPNSAPNFPFDAVGDIASLEESIPEVGHHVSEIASAYVVQPNLPREEYFTAEVNRPLLPRQEFLSGKELSHTAEPWTILRENHPPGTLHHLAQNIVRSGVDASGLHDVPRGRFGDLLTVDRMEIEDFRSIRSLFDEYRRGEAETPLSIAVFGAPGSGKSFAVMQVLEDFKELGERMDKLEFNLSQFDKPNALVDAFHLVRDARLRGNMPIVFWDEFDTSLDHQEFGWLRYFLSPMQDGKFREGDTIHPIGRCIFVFAGGRASRFQEFLDIAKRDEARFRALKGPDFLSRIRGYIDIRGPNEEASCQLFSEPDDPYFIVRRAVTLRSLLWVDRKNLFHPRPQKGEKDSGKHVLYIDDGILDAFLRVGKYEHGVRSMKAIIEMSALADKDRFDRSSLPAITQLSLHVKARDFLRLMRTVEFSMDVRELIEQSAAGLCKKLYEFTKDNDQARDAQADDYKFPQIDSFDQVSQEVREQYLDFVRRVPDMLGDVGYRIVPAPQPEKVEQLPGDIIEELARKEHEYWVERQNSAQKYDRTQTGSLLVGWKSLPRKQKDVERQRFVVVPQVLMESIQFSVQRYVKE